MSFILRSSRFGAVASMRTRGAQRAFGGSAVRGLKESDRGMWFFWLSLSLFLFVCERGGVWNLGLVLNFWHWIFEFYIKTSPSPPPHPHHNPIPSHPHPHPKPPSPPKKQPLTSRKDNPTTDNEKHKQDQLAKQKEGKGHWKPELASDSEEAVCCFLPLW